jgi:hypothetical protein
VTAPAATRWVPIGNIKGPPGPPGPPGDDGTGIADASFDSQGRLTLVFTDGRAFVSTSLVGPEGPPGRSVNIEGSVASEIDLPVSYGPTDLGLGWLTSDDGHLHV